MKSITIILAIGCIVGIVVHGKAQDTVKQRNFEKEFNTFKQSIENDFERQSRKNDSVLLIYLNGIWKEFQVFTQERVKRVKPEQQPIAPKTIESIELPEPKINPKSIPIVPDSTILHSEPGVQPMELNSMEINSGQLNYFDFLGQKVWVSRAENEASHSNVPFDDKKTKVIRFYEQYASKDSWQKISHELYLLSQAKQLNDWGFYYLLSVASESIFQDLDEQVLFTWLSLLKNGINARIAYDKESIYVLAAFKEKIYNTGVVTILGQDYYLLNRRNDKISGGLHTYEANYPGELKPVSVEMKTLPKLANIPENRIFIFDLDTLQIRINLSLINFYAAYPDCNLPVYFNTPLSPQAISSLDASLKPMMKDKTETDKVAILLKFVQDAFPYKLDMEQFGREKYFFPDETLHYPYSDCEDRAVFLVKLIYLYTNLTAVGLEYSDHVSVAVKLDEPIMGSYVVFKNDRYYICDPTFIGAGLGMAMDEMKKQSPDIIVVN
ncbi:MAG: hypothetical protein WCI48_12530 [Bacteroidota bacterium]